MAHQTRSTCHIPPLRPSASSTSTHLRSRSLGGAFASLSADPLTGPALPPLDFGTLLQSDDAMHAALARTVEDLAQWLAVVEVGLTGVLEKMGADIIEEEGETDDGTPRARGISVDGELNIRHEWTRGRHRRHGWPAAVERHKDRACSFRSQIPPLASLSSSSSVHLRSSSFGGAFASLSADPLTGPALPPLDFGALLQSDDAMHAALARTVDDLAQWLAVVEVGLTGVLDKMGADIIEEEGETDDGTPGARDVGVDGELNGVNGHAGDVVVMDVLQL